MLVSCPHPKRTTLLCATAGIIQGRDPCLQYYDVLYCVAVPIVPATCVLLYSSTVYSVVYRQPRYCIIIVGEPSTYFLLQIGERQKRPLPAQQAKALEGPY
jgi:hypothetical protein